MERGAVNPERSKVSFADRLVSLCEYYMTLGVPYDEFWHGDYCKLKFYEKQYFNQQKVKDGEMWRQGLYFWQALKAFGNQLTGDGKVKYPDKPFSMERNEETMTQEELLANIDAELRATIKES